MPCIPYTRTKNCAFKFLEQHRRRWTNELAAHNLPLHYRYQYETALPYGLISIMQCCIADGLFYIIRGFGSVTLSSWELYTAEKNNLD
jgi:hypothetical protein